MLGFGFGFGFGLGFRFGIRVRLSLVCMSGEGASDPTCWFPWCVCVLVSHGVCVCWFPMVCVFKYESEYYEQML